MLQLLDLLRQLIHFIHESRHLSLAVWVLTGNRLALGAFAVVATVTLIIDHLIALWSKLASERDLVQRVHY